ncbi:MAG: hypothetical protein HN742_05585 [Lentisphaerae bacterium]|nr:hypothetical protein [Lentisphaerota bacterium]MBT4815758.1 hypothetical protein [Lentisphaerota bacterium]MBT5607674.1 hypothetical protein [Lentisphaerota bacterium]MBT7055175.1 hypothetical protein [Lentisphaerota bacterium]MBT7841321.1 hypothetical protein [Lentisphaerota bacterium]
MDQEITSFDAAEPGAFGDILNVDRGPAVPAKVGLLAVGYFEYWRMYPSLRATVETDLAKVAERLAAKVDVVYPGMVDNLDRAEEAGRALAEAGVDVVVVVEGTYLPDYMVLHALEHVPHARVVLFNTQTGAGVRPSDDYEATMRNSALIGVTQLSGSFTKARRDYDVVVGEIAEDRGYEEIARIARVRAAVARLRACNLGLIGHVFRGMYDLEFDRGSVRGCLGPEVISVQADHLVDLWQDVAPDNVRARAAQLTDRFAVRGVTATDIERSVRLGIAMERLSARYKLDGLCFLGQHYLEKMTGAPARIGASMMMEDGVMVACEGDVGGLVMMQLMHDLTGRAPVQMEWGQFDVNNNALFLLGHGIASPDAAADPTGVTLTRAPEEWGFEGAGVNWEFILRPGPVTLGHFISTPDGWRMLISEGESIEFSCLPCDEIHGMVRVQSPVCDYLKQLIKLGVTHHAIVIHEELVPELELAAELMGVDSVVLR